MTLEITFSNNVQHAKLQNFLPIMLNHSDISGDTKANKFFFYNFSWYNFEKFIQNLNLYMWCVFHFLFYFSVLLVGIFLQFWKVIYIGVVYRLSLSLLVPLIPEVQKTIDGKAKIQTPQLIVWNVFILWNSKKENAVVGLCQQYFFLYIV